ATSAVCVTGLVVHDTMLYWSTFGQIVILILIQIGGMGIVTLSALVIVAAKQRIGIQGRTAMQDSIGGSQVGGIVGMTLFIVKVMVSVELLGAVLLSFTFIPLYGPLKGVCFSVFHSVSAFCNAGFDLMGEQGAFSSLTGFSSNINMNLTVCALIITGGIGFFTWRDIAQYGFRIRYYRMQTKVVLTTTAVLILLPAACFFFLEYRGLPAGERILSSLFQAVTPRTAGFNTQDYMAMSDSGRALTIVLMLIGGSPGSTAGGMKITTAFVIMAASASVFSRTGQPSAFGRGISDAAVRQSTALLLVYLGLFLVSGMAISSIEQLPLGMCLFETASAVGTVGMTMGITSSLGGTSRIILILLMFIGRTGGLTIAKAFIRDQMIQNQIRRYPQDSITVG
ncbi:MAG: TrkH family potassium uptake protein, partial [bacterium]